MNSHITLENGRYGRRAVLTSTWSNQLIEYLTSKSVVELELNQAKGWNGKDLSFLAELPDLKAFEIFDFNIRNIELVHCLHNLERLGITTYCKTKIDFSSFPKLESCGLEWRPNTTSLFDCITLKDLFINRYKGKNIVPFTKLVNLESLTILNAPIENIYGLNTLTELRFLRLANLKRLTSLKGIERLTSLKELEIHTCRGIDSINEIGSLLHLRKLYLNNNGNIESLKPLDNLDELESILFYESTNIVDGDLSPLLQQKNLSSVSFQNRRHYSHRRECFNNTYMR